jgi:spore coat polysaccharide biosynthesis predicted glycosyltransferase SpsG
MKNPKSILKKSNRKEHLKVRFLPVFTLMNKQEIFNQIPTKKTSNPLNPFDIKDIKTAYGEGATPLTLEILKELHQQKLDTWVVSGSDSFYSVTTRASKMNKIQLLHIDINDDDDIVIKDEHGLELDVVYRELNEFVFIINEEDETPMYIFLNKI